MIDENGGDLVGAAVGPMDNNSEFEGRRSKLGRAVLWCVIAATLSGAVAVAVVRSPEPSPAAELAEVRRFVTEGHTAHFTGTSRSESGEGSDEPGSTSIDTSRIEGSFELPDRMRYVEDDGYAVSEYIQVPGATYSRDADSREELEAELWVYEEADAPEPATNEAPVGNLDSVGLQVLSTASEVFGGFGSSFDLSDLLSRLNGVRRVSPGVLEATMKVRDLMPPALVTAMENQVQAAAAHDEGEPDEPGEYGDFEAEFLDSLITIRLVHADDGRLDRFEMKSEFGKGEDRSVDAATMSFSDWGKPVQIVAPATADVDLTPSIDEAELASFREFPILVPATPPAGMVLRAATVESPEFDDETDGCGFVHLSYAAKADEGAPDANLGLDGPFGMGPFLSVNLRSASCRGNGFIDLDPTGAEGEAVNVGSYTGQLRRRQMGPADMRVELVTVQFTVGDVLVNAQTNLRSEEALATLATVAPLDLAAQPIEPSVPPGG